jgi:hypothetical protein
MDCVSAESKKMNTKDYTMNVEIKLLMLNSWHLELDEYPCFWI